MERLEDGEVSPYLTDQLRAGDQLELRSPIGGYFVYWHRELGGPVSSSRARLRVVPFLAMLRHRGAGKAVTGRRCACCTRRGPRTTCWRAGLTAARDGGAEVAVTLTRSWPPGWAGLTGRVDAAMLRRCAWPRRTPDGVRRGPTAFVEVVADHLVAAGHEPARVKTERFGASG